ncbi:hypothetical protein PBY51_005382 [Eleginops maclovinus]|uniref:Pro-FMRFamide-related neuropeptide VF n=1 Tax=Eleginops maclovinus TaxID=56733 RepID=A0AAN7X767_ELEMC|nr:hypothetical protein PBY51_005382 [Eleginops maclovinus]
MSPAVNMVTVVLLLMLGAVASDLQVHGKSINRVKTLLSSDYGRHSVRKQPQQQTKSDIRRSLDQETYKVRLRPTSSRISLPIIIKLHPPTAKPLHLHANMPMRFGRENLPGDERAPNSSPNMPQRFGRSWDTCAECRDVREALLPQRFGRSSPFWSLLRTMAKAQLVNTGLHWADVFDLKTSSEELEMQEKTFKRMKEGLTSQHQGLYKL